jgi:hypothetical protein
MQQVYYFLALHPRSPPLRRLATLPHHRNRRARAGAGRGAVSAKAFNHIDGARAHGAAVPGRNCAQRGSRPRGRKEVDAAFGRRPIRPSNSGQFGAYHTVARGCCCASQQPALCKLPLSVSGINSMGVTLYRIHQRLIRTRRIDVEQWAMRPRGPVDNDSGLPNLSHVRLYYAKCSMELLQALEGWRISSQGAPPQLHQDLVRRWVNLLEVTSQGAWALEALLASYVELYPAELQHIQELRGLAAATRTDSSRYAAASQALKDWRLANRALTNSGVPRKIVCFASDTSDALALYNVLLRDIGYGDVVRAVGSDSSSSAK